MSRPIAVFDRLTETIKTTTFSASNTTASETIATLTGQVWVRALWGVVTTQIGVNHTGGYFELDDATNQVPVSTSIGGLTLSAYTVGSLVTRYGLVANTAVADKADEIRITDPATAGNSIFTDFVAVEKNGATNVIQWTYTTTDTPTTGAIEWHVLYQPLTSSSSLTGTQTLLTTTNRYA